MTVVVRPEILSSLQSVREDVQRQIAGLERYRALKAIEQTIVDFPGLEDLTRSLSDIRDHVQEQLNETREYRALRTIERVMPELSEVFALLDERSEVASSQAVEEAAGNASADDRRTESAAAVDGQEIPVTVVATIAEENASDLPHVVAVPPEPLQREPLHAGTDRLDPGEAPMAANDVDSADDAAISASATTSYGIAQFLNTEERSERPPTSETHADDGLGQFRMPPSQEGRAA